MGASRRQPSIKRLESSIDGKRVRPTALTEGLSDSRRINSVRIKSMWVRATFFILLFVTGGLTGVGQGAATTDVTLFFNGYVRGSFEPCG